MHKGIGLGTVFRNLLWEKKKEIEIDFLINEREKIPVSLLALTQYREYSLNVVKF